MLYHLAKHLVSASLVSFGLLAVILSLLALLRICRRPILKLPTATLVVLSIFAVISAGVADKTRGSGQAQNEGLSPCVPRYDSTGEQGSQPRTIPDSMPRLPDACDVGEDEGFVGMPCVSNLTVAAILRGSNETANVVAWHPSFRPLGDLVDFYGGTPARIINSWLTLRSLLGDVGAWMQANADNRAWNACAIVKGEKYVFFRSRFKGVFKMRAEILKGAW
jgi:hypothetical protein